MDLLKHMTQLVLRLSVLFILCYNTHTKCEAKHLPKDINQFLIKERWRLAKTWAPKVWLHSKEVFFPSDVDYFFKNVIVSSEGEKFQANQTVSSTDLPMGEESENLHLLAPLDIDCSNCPLPEFLFGIKPTKEHMPPVYATINSCLPDNYDLKLDNKQIQSNKILKRQVTTKKYPKVSTVSSSPKIDTNQTTQKEEVTTTTTTTEQSTMTTENQSTSDTFSETRTSPTVETTTPTTDEDSTTLPSTSPDEITEVPAGDEDKSSHKFTVTYWMFYPYNNGKTICSVSIWGIRIPKLMDNNTCQWDEITMGNHVGDWEHISIYFKDDKPEKLYISTHYFGAFYSYNESSNSFYYYGQDARVGPLLNVDYPKEVQVDGSQPVVYSALGSHGLWASEGEHIYNSNIIPLHDDTDKGTLWDVRQNLQVLDRRDMVQMYRPDRQWLRYQGYWGNPSSHCHIGMLGFCELTQGPLGIPRKRTNFPCYDPYHETFHPYP